MNTKTLFQIASAGIIAGFLSVYFYNETLIPKPPISVSFNPYEHGIYASGIVESLQRNGSNSNIFPAVSGPVVKIYVEDNKTVEKGQPLLEIDKSIQQGVLDQAVAQLQYAEASLVNVTEQYEKVYNSYEMNEKSISQNVFDNAKNAVIIAQQSVEVARGQLTAAQATMAFYTVRAPFSGIVMRVVPTIGDYVSPLIGAYDPTTQGPLPVIQMSEDMTELQVRAYVDEILVPNLPLPDDFEATLYVRGLNNRAIPLKFVNMQPYTIPNIQLSDARNERVDVRVLPIVFKFERPKDINIFPGQLVDIYIKGKS